MYKTVRNRVPLFQLDQTITIIGPRWGFVIPISYYKAIGSSSAARITCSSKQPYGRAPSYAC